MNSEAVAAAIERGMVWGRPSGWKSIKTVQNETSLESPEEILAGD